MAATALLLFSLLLVPLTMGETCDSQEMEERWKRKEEQMEVSWKIREAEMEAKMEAILEAKLEAKIKENLPAATAGSVRNVPYEMVCGYKYGFSTASTTIPYDKITSEFNNAARPGGGDGQLDIESGVFTSRLHRLHQSSSPASPAVTTLWRLPTRQK